MIQNFNYVICNLVIHFHWEKYFLVGSLETSIINLCVRYILNNVNNLKQTKLYESKAMLKIHLDDIQND